MLWSLVLSFSMIVFSGGPDYVYRWTDSDGRVRVTNDPSSVPENKKTEIKPMRLLTIEPVEKTATAGANTLLSNLSPVSFTEKEGGIVVSSMFNGVAMRSAIVDTGSEVAVITTKLAVALGYDIKSARVGRFLTPGGSVTAPVVLLGSVQVGPAMVKDVMAVVIDFEGRGLVSAVIGMNFLSRFVFKIDYSAKNISFLAR